MSTRPIAPRRQRQQDSSLETTARLPGDLVRVRQWLQSHLCESVRLDQLALIAGVKPRTLEAHCRQYLGTTPLAWLRETRLMRARHALLDAADEDTVTRVALDSGFCQTGRFAALYGRRFGERPSQTLRRARQGAADDVDDEALLLTWSAMPAAFAVAPAQCKAALQKLDRALELTPDYGLAKALAAWCWSQRAAQHFSSTPFEDLARSLRMAEQVRALAPTDSVALTLASGALALAHRLDEADRLLERALALDPWSAIAWLRRGWVSAYHGDSETALRELKTTLHLMPFEPVRHLAFIGIGCAHFTAGRYERAACWVRAGIEACPGSFWAARILAAAAVLAGTRSEGRRVVMQVLRKDPDLTVTIAQKAWPFPQDFMARLADGLETAGLPRG